MRSVLAILAVLAASALLACGPRARTLTSARGVLLIVVDGLRADHVGALGYDRPTTPSLDALAARGIAFTNTWSASPDLLPAHVALLSGCDPALARRVGIVARGGSSDRAAWFVPDGVPRIAREFLSRGFATAAFVDDAALAPVHGVALGFQDFYGFREEGVNPRAEVGFDSVAAKFTQWLNERAAGQNWFAYVHLSDLVRALSRGPDDPRWTTFFEPRAELAFVPAVAEGGRQFHAMQQSRLAAGALTLGEHEARYDGALRELDQKLGRLFERLRRHGHLDAATIAVVGSHGLSFGEGGLYLDSGALAAPDLHVPWIVRPSPRFEGPRGGRCAQLASTCDVAPTLLELAGLGAPSSMQGVSHYAELRGESRPLRAFAYASGGLRDARGATDGREVVELASPGERARSEAWTSWLGEREGVEVSTLVLATDVRGNEIAAESTSVQALAAAARAWFLSIDRSREVLHARDPSRSNPAEVEALRLRGWLTR